MYNQGYPTYTITAQNVGSGQAKCTISQSQSDASVSYFEMPVPIRVFGNGGQQLDLVLNNTVNGESFTENVPFTITSITFDPEKNIISKSNSATLSRKKFELTTAQLFLNPVNHILSLDISNGINIEKVQFYNVTGQKIKTANSISTWDISYWSSGVYIISVQTDAGTKKLKFVKN